ncbi:hypothetical protein [Clostridium hydrogenum]|uniref:hypothetical protein n=1 Tax=Clostridium hydrogenum TaxID=2855764 RepID=UPI001F1E88BD|nr:hypothetical protein [Clostridium hydrogenum]
MEIALGIVGLITMIIFSFIGIWGFIILKQLLNQAKYKNYLMEKLIESIILTSKKTDDSQIDDTSNSLEDENMDNDTIKF